MPSPLSLSESRCAGGRRTPFLSVLALRAPHQTWRLEADKLVDGALASSRPTMPEREVYVIVLDGLGHGDVLHDLYGVDVTALEAYLRASGFHIANRARPTARPSCLSPRC